tara:strand:- start:12949 stop:13290 length:342 start_codon:yes stop_codon:yes gene_type:complete
MLPSLLPPISTTVSSSPVISTHPDAGTLQCPGGHLEHGESFATTAAREVLEETGLEIGEIAFLTATNDVFAGEGKHYVTVFVTARIVGSEKVAKVRLPHCPVSQIDLGVDGGW